MVSWARSNSRSLGLECVATATGITASFLEKRKIIVNQLEGKISREGGVLADEARARESY